MGRQMLWGRFECSSTTVLSAYVATTVESPSGNNHYIVSSRFTRHGSKDKEAGEAPQQAKREGRLESPLGRVGPGPARPCSGVRVLR